MPALLATQEEADAALGRCIRELVRDLGQAVYVPPTEDETSAVQVIALDEPLRLEKNSVIFAGSFQPATIG